MHDIGIDLGVNNGPPRRVNLSDWESRLIEHCLKLYLDVAEVSDDPSAHLAASILEKLWNASVPPDSTRDSRREDRRRESKRVAWVPAHKGSATRN